jgi:hypothetical protein
MMKLNLSKALLFALVARFFPTPRRRVRSETTAVRARRS